MERCPSAKAKGKCDDGKSRRMKSNDGYKYSTRLCGNGSGGVNTYHSNNHNGYELLA